MESRSRASPEQYAALIEFMERELNRPRHLRQVDALCEALFKVLNEKVYIMNSMSYQGETNRVLITGFGPFSGLDLNPSWEGVNMLNNEEVERKYNIHLFKEKVDVVYQCVDKSVPKLWSKIQPDLTIHVGVSGQTPCFLLETQACKDGYSLSDLTGTCPVNFTHWSNGPETLATDLDVDILCKEFNCDPPAEGLRAEKSYDAGRYLCEYTYYTSLSCGTSKTLFIHVPLTEYSFEQIAVGLERIIDICIRQIRSNEV